MDKKIAKKAVGMHDKQMHGGKKTDLTSLKKGGAMHKMPDGSMMAGKSHGTKKMFGGGLAAMGGGLAAKVGGLGPRMPRGRNNMTKSSKSSKGRFVDPPRSVPTGPTPPAPEDRFVDPPRSVPTGPTPPAPQVTNNLLAQKMQKVLPSGHQAAVAQPMKKGGGVKKMAKGGGIESRGKTRGKMC